MLYINCICINILWRAFLAEFIDYSNQPIDSDELEGKDYNDPAEFNAWLTACQWCACLSLVFMVASLIVSCVSTIEAYLSMRRLKVILLIFIGLAGKI